MRSGEKASPHVAVADLLDRHKPEAVIMHSEVTKEETDVEARVKQECERRGVALKKFWGATLIHRNDLPFRISQLPDTFTQFRKACERGRSGLDDIVWECYDAPSKMHPLPDGVSVGALPSLRDLGVSADELGQNPQDSAFPFQGGESAALRRLADYTFGTHGAKTYKETRNGLIGSEYSTKFSPWLAAGALSPRKIYWTVKEFERDVVANKSTYWIIFELLWRDYFRFVCSKYGNSVFFITGIMDKKKRWKRNADSLKRWCRGTTGIPFVDANMRELLATGFMSNRGRQNVASFLVHNLQHDWRAGAEWFEHTLLDHDVCSNYGNWNYAAGIGNDSRRTTLQCDQAGARLRSRRRVCAKVASRA